MHESHTPVPTAQACRRPSSAVWPLLALAGIVGIAVFVVPRAAGRPISAAWRYGALFGWVLFGVYDFTNYSTLRDWPLILAVVDTVWGVTATAICAAAVWMVTR